MADDALRRDEQAKDEENRDAVFRVRYAPDYGQVLDHLTLGVAILDEDCRILFWNRWMAEHSDLGLEDIYGHPIYELFPALSHKGFVKKVHRAFVLGTPAFLTGSPDHHIFPFFSSRSLLGDNLKRMQQTVIISPLKDAAGTVRQVLVSIFDVTDWVTNRDQLLESRKRLQRLSQIDELTQIPNRRSVSERLRTECCIHARKKRPLSLALIDIDYFKGLNDTHGHPCGDRVLIDMASVITSALRGYDTVGRYGGEEFLLILPETDLGQATLICDRLRRLIAEETFVFEDLRIKITVSIGVASRTNADAASEEELLRRADGCLYHAKRTGRDRVVNQEMM